MTTLFVTGPSEVAGSVSIPGDKSISHRGLMLGAVATGRTTLRNVAPGADVASTTSCLAGYGTAIERRDAIVTIDSSGIEQWREPQTVLDCGNSGTTMRLLTGLAAQLETCSRFDGDASLRRRPMERVAKPLRVLGAKVTTSEGGVPPVEVEGGNLHGAVIDTEVSSAQVKSAVLLAALGADDRCIVTEPFATRDHTERMLAALGAEISWARTPEGNTIDLLPYIPPPFEVNVPGDISSAAFVIAAGVVAGATGGMVDMEGVGLNLSRIGFLEALRTMGADVSWDVTEERMHEAVGRIESRRSSLSPITIGEAEIPTIHDELPLLAILATQAEGESVVRGAGELRVKESDRIATTVAGLRRMGADIDEFDDGFVVRGPVRLRGATVDSAHDHRIAMAFAVAGLIAEGQTRIEGFESADVSWPAFGEVLASLGAKVELR
jgi:3-phosphoshikimate 1-carboxyvinyltransferase